jgi:Skp family chaperone for outer membrane proteins
MKLNKSLTDKALALINDYAKDKKIDMVIDKGEKVRGPVLFGDPTLDITDDIVQAMNS